MIAIVGGKADGHQSPLRVPKIELDGETYLLMTYREDDKLHRFYMLAGHVPAEALRIHQGRIRVAKGLGK